MTSVAPAGAPTEANYRRRVTSIAISSGVGAFALSFWYPFLPLYMLHLGATSDANALAWVAAAVAAQGLTRIVGGPLWGMVADRVGRKPMLIRALLGISVATALTSLATEPWMMVATLGLQGAVAGLEPASVALTSVSVPRARLTSGLATVQIANQTGRVLGPATGALLVALLDYRGAFMFAAVLPLVSSVLLFVVVPRDITGSRQGAPAVAAAPVKSREGTLLGFQFILALLLIVAVGSMSQVVSLFMPTQMRRLAGEDEASSYVGVAFTLSGIMSIAGTSLVMRWLRGAGRVRTTVVALIPCVALVHLAFIAAGNAYLVIGLYALMTLFTGALLPTNNTLIAANVTEDRRGRAFGWVSSAQALSLMVGPIAAAFFAAISLDLGYTVTASVLALVALLVLLRLREPSLANLS